MTKESGRGVWSLPQHTRVQTLLIENEGLCIALEKTRVCLGWAKFSEPGPASGSTEGTRERAGSVIPCDITSLFPWATDSEGSEQIPKGNAPDAVM